MGKSSTVLKRKNRKNKEQNLSLVKEPNKPRTTIVLDTNVLLNNPKILDTYQDSEIVIPQIVLTELDKVKQVKGDAGLRYRSREVNRVLFDLAEKGKLTKGVNLDRRSSLRVEAVDPTFELPQSLRSKSADDLIVATAYQLIHKEGHNDTILVTSDLNMLLKAQSLDIPVERYDMKNTDSIWGRLTSVKWQNRLVIIFLVILVGILSIPTILGRNPLSPTEGPPELVNKLQQYQVQKARFEKKLEKDPDDMEALTGLASLYFENREFNKAIPKYQEILNIKPNDHLVKVDMTIALYNVGLKEDAFRTLNDVIRANPNFDIAYFNRAAMYLQENRYKEAYNDFQNYLRLSPNGRLAGEARTHITRLQHVLEEFEKKNKEKTN